MLVALWVQVFIPSDAKLLGPINVQPRYQPKLRHESAVWLYVVMDTVGFPQARQHVFQRLCNLQYICIAGE